MATRVRSYSKINLGLAIGAPRPDGFHGLTTLYQTLALHDCLTVAARLAPTTRIHLSSNDARVPTDARNTVWKMVEKALQQAGFCAVVRVHIHKNLPIQGGMGAGSANAAAVLLGLERELPLRLASETRLAVAAAVGSDVPLFLVGGTVLGTDRGQQVTAVADLSVAGQTEIPCVVALPGIGVSTPQAFREWDRRSMVSSHSAAACLQEEPNRDTLLELGRIYASAFPQGGTDSANGASGIFPAPSSEHLRQNSPENLHGLSREQRHTTSGLGIDLAENSLLALVRTGIENDFEKVVFSQHPPLREIKRHLMGSPVTGNGDSRDGAGDSAIYAALSGSGSALFGLYRTSTDAEAAQHRLQQNGTQAIVTSTMPRPLYWRHMFAE